MNSNKQPVLLFTFLVLFFSIAILAFNFQSHSNNKFLVQKSDILGLNTQTLSQTDKIRILSLSNQYLNINLSKLNITDSASASPYSISKENTTGITHVRYQQVYNNVPVYGSQISLHLNSNDSYNSSSGQFVNNLNMSDTPQISSVTATAKAVSAWKQITILTQANPITKVSLVIYAQEIFNPNLSKQSFLSWHITITDRAAPYQFFIDAQNGNILYQASTLVELNRIIYDCSLATSSDISCYVDKLIDGVTYGRSEGKPPVGTHPVYKNSDVDAAYDLIPGIHNYYQTKFNRNGIDGTGGYIGNQKYEFYTYFEKIKPTNFCPNAQYSKDIGVVACSDMVNQIIIGHESQHGVNFFSVKPDGMIYTFESGALNEGLADTYGIFSTKAITGKLDWNVVKRNLSDPASGSYSAGGQDVPYPDRHYAAGMYCITGTPVLENDFGGVHLNSTIFGHAAYIMTIGKNFNGCNVTGIGVEKVEQILYSALNNYFTSSGNFNEAFIAINFACTNLIGKYNITADDCMQVENAMIATEMNQAGKCSAIPQVAPVCKTVANTPLPTVTPPTGSIVPTLTLTPPYVSPTTPV
ncbi:MAG: M4 family metallopeptidase, partial [bacterium]